MSHMDRHTEYRYTATHGRAQYIAAGGRGYVTAATREHERRAVGGVHIVSDMRSAVRRAINGNHTEEGVRAGWPGANNFRAVY